MFTNICVYCSSSDAVDPIFFDGARELGATLAERGHTLIFGGAKVGLMGELARSAQARGAKVIGVIPTSIKDLALEGLPELVTTKDMRERKAAMEARADAFVVLPGGFGTMEETFETLNAKMLGHHSKPVVLLNIGDFFAPLKAFLEQLYRHRFAKPIFRELYHFAPDVKEVFNYLDKYKPAHLQGKWFRAE
jgi:uncharacterized protein (TIGR00730 family)